MRTRLVMMTLCVCAAAAAPSEAQKGKPAPQPIVNWRCDVVMRDAEEDATTPEDAIKSDGLGKYRDGEGAFTCSMSPVQSAQAGNPAPGSATFYFDRRPTRSFYFPARAGSWSAAYDTELQIRVFSLVNMAEGTPETRAMAIPTSAIGAMYADGLGVGDTTALVTVVRTGSCTWEVTFDAPNATVQRYTSLDRRRLIDRPQLPLGFTLTTRRPVGSSIDPCPD